MAAAEPAGDDEDDALALPDTGLPDPDKPAGRKRGRKPLPAELPRQRIEYDLSEDQKICPCCEGAMHRLGEEISEQSHIEVKVSVLQHVRFKYACRHCERNAERTPVVTAPMPAQPLPGSNASPAMLATVTTGKYVDGTPLYRMEDALGRAGIEVGRGTLANWIIPPMVAGARKSAINSPQFFGLVSTAACEGSSINATSRMAPTHIASKNRQSPMVSRPSAARLKPKARAATPRLRSWLSKLE